MFKPVATLAAAGIIGVVVTKFLWALLLPMLAVMFGVFMLVVKVALIVGLVWLALKIFGKITERPAES